MSGMNTLIKVELPDLQFNTKEEWEKNGLSAAWHAQWGDRNLPHHQPRASSEPTQFPCIGMVWGFTYNPDGPSYEHIFWSYDFELKE